MAANEDRTSLWRTPLSTPIKSNENGFQDLFKHSEKLLASAVSICRLKGSVECQTGGIITVCEEMQRLIRLAFNETARLERELKKQRAAYEDDLSVLKERLAYLEEGKDIKITSKEPKAQNHSIERTPLKPCTFEKVQDNSHPVVQAEKKTPINKVQVNNPIDRKIANEKPKQTADQLANSGLMGVSSESLDTIDVNLEEDGDSNLERPQETADQIENSGVKRIRSVPLDTIDVNLEEDGDSSLEVSVFEISRKNQSKPKKQKASNKQQVNQDDEGKIKCKKSEPKVSKKPQMSSKRKRGAEKMDDDEKNAENKDKETKKGKKNKITEGSKKKQTKIETKDTIDSTFDANESAGSDVFLNPESGLLEIKECSDLDEDEIKSEISAKAQEFITKVTSASKNAKKGERRPRKCKKEAITILNDESIQSIPESPRSGPSSPIKPVKDIPVYPKAAETMSNPKEIPAQASQEPDEVLGDMSFLIDISSKISSFVGDSAQEKTELPLMQARERADARKLANLFNLHVVIGKKSDNRSSLILSKTPSSKMPKSGKLDNLLSKLSIAAAKEAERIATKSRNKRKHAAFNDAMDDEDNDFLARKTREVRL